MHWIFAYGSLTNYESRMKTLETPVSCVRTAVILPGWGYRTAFNVHSTSSDETYMGFVPGGKHIPGKLLHVTDSQMKKLMKREERYYDLKRVPNRFVVPDPGEDVYVFFPKKVGHERAPSIRYRTLVPDKFT